MPAEIPTRTLKTKQKRNGRQTLRAESLKRRHLYSREIKGSTRTLFFDCFPSFISSLPATLQQLILHNVRLTGSNGSSSSPAESSIQTDVIFPTKARTQNPRAGKSTQTTGTNGLSLSPLSLRFLWVDTKRGGSPSVCNMMIHNGAFIDILNNHKESFSLSLSLSLVRIETWPGYYLFPLEFPAEFRTPLNHFNGYRHEKHRDSDYRGYFHSERSSSSSSSHHHRHLSIGSCKMYDAIDRIDFINILYTAAHTRSRYTPNHFH